MKVRCCFTILQQWRPCLIGWGRVGSEGVKTCADDPMEQNCHNIVDTEDILICPTCGSACGLIGDTAEVEDAEKDK